jgi:MYXO-CTERM domain-containing protein
VTLLLALSLAHASTGEDWEETKILATNGAEEDMFGRSVSTAGDVNGDGFDDIVVGASLADGRGAAYVYHGSATGLQLTSELSLNRPNDTVDHNLGWAVSGGGDLNGDGFSDVLVSDPNDDTNGPRSGAVFVYWGSATGASPDRVLKLTSPKPSDYGDFGFSVDHAGDLNGDGFDDIIVGETKDDELGPGVGAAWVFLGSASGLDGGTKLLPSDDTAFQRFGGSVAGVGDVDGDGFGDVVVGASLSPVDEVPNAGVAYLYFGGSTGVSSEKKMKIEPDDFHQGSSFANSLAGAGDLNGDGFDDIVLGSYAFQNATPDSNGNAFVAYGSASGPSGPLTMLWPSDGPISNQFGVGLGAAGDANGDGFDDLLVGAPAMDDVGAVYLFLGTAAGLDVDNPIRLDASDGLDGDKFGFSVAGAGDVNGDGVDDLLVGAAWDDDLGTEAGSAFLFIDARPIESDNTDTDTDTEPDTDQEPLDDAATTAGESPACGCSTPPAGQTWLGMLLVVAGTLHRRSL